MPGRCLGIETQKEETKGVAFPRGRLGLARWCGVSYAHVKLLKELGRKNSFLAPRFTDTRLGKKTFQGSEEQQSKALPAPTYLAIETIRINVFFVPFSLSLVFLTANTLCNEYE